MAILILRSHWIPRIRTLCGSRPRWWNPGKPARTHSHAFDPRHGGCRCRRASGKQKPYGARVRNGNRHGTIARWMTLSVNVTFQWRKYVTPLAVRSARMTFDMGQWSTVVMQRLSSVLGMPCMQSAATPDADHSMNNVHANTRLRSYRGSARHHESDMNATPYGMKKDARSSRIRTECCDGAHRFRNPGWNGAAAAHDVGSSGDRNASGTGQDAARTRRLAVACGVALGAAVETSPMRPTTKADGETQMTIVVVQMGQTASGQRCCRVATQRNSMKVHSNPNRLAPVREHALHAVHARRTFISGIAPSHAGDRYGIGPFVPQTKPRPTLARTGNFGLPRTGYAPGRSADCRIAQTREAGVATEALRSLAPEVGADRVVAWASGALRPGTFSNQEG